MVAWERLRSKPNLCLIVVDSLRANALNQVAGSARIPNIERLISEGVQFRRAFSHSPSTLPAHASLFTARLPHETGVVQDGQSFAGEVDLLTTELSRVGYETHGVVSLSALWIPRTGFGIERGFDSWTQGNRQVTRAEEVRAQLAPHLDRVEKHEPFFLFAHFSDPHQPYNAHGATKNEAGVYWKGELLDTVSTSEASFIEQDLRVPPGMHMFELRSDQPFRVRDFASTAPPGVTVKPRPSDLETADGDTSVMVNNQTDSIETVTISAWIHDTPSVADSRARYRREIEAVDAAIGAIIADLEARDLYDDTLIVLTSDHGEALGEHGIMGHGSSLYDEALAIPLVLKLPKRSELRNGLARQMERLARQIDIAPTILDILGLNPMRSASGSSLVQSKSRVLFAEARSGEPTRLVYCMRDERYKLIYFADENRFEMHDLAQDPSELDDVFRTQGHLRSEWQQELKTLLRRVQ